MKEEQIKAFIKKAGVEEVLNCIDRDDVLDFYDFDDIFSLNRVDDEELVEELESRGYIIWNPDRSDLIDYVTTRTLVLKAISNLHGRGICTPQRAKELVIDYIENHLTCSIVCNRNKD